MLLLAECLPLLCRLLLHLVHAVIILLEPLRKGGPGEGCAWSQLKADNMRTGLPELLLSCDFCDRIFHLPQYSVQLSFKVGFIVSEKGRDRH